VLIIKELSVICTENSATFLILVLSASIEAAERAELAEFPAPIKPESSLGERAGWPCVGVMLII
jgi:hypothetical protein